MLTGTSTTMAVSARQQAGCTDAATREPLGSAVLLLAAARVPIMFTMDDAADPRLLRLLDLAEHEFVRVSCLCGRIVEYRAGVLQRLRRVSSATLVYDLQFRLRCRHCNRRSGFRIAVVDRRGRGDNSAPRRERVLVRGDDGPG